MYRLRTDQPLEFWQKCLRCIIYSRRRQDSPIGGYHKRRHAHALIDRACVSNACPARFARTATASDSKGSHDMQYCPSDSSAVERGVAERIQLNRAGMQARGYLERA